MTFVYSFDPQETLQEEELDFNPFSHILDFPASDYDDFDSPEKDLEVKDFDHSFNKCFIRVISTFNKNKRVKVSENDDNVSRCNGDFTNDYTNPPVRYEDVVDEEKADYPDLNINISQSAEKAKSENLQELSKKREVKKAKQQKTPIKRRKRKGVVRRDQYRKRKDVLMKGVLRKCRKYFQEKYTIFARAKYLETLQKSSDQNEQNESIFDEVVPEIEQDVLEAFCAAEFPSKAPRYITYYMGAMIFPYEYKTLIQDKAVKPRPVSKTEKYVEICDLVYEVLYKFSYQKLDKFCSVPQLAYLFLKFHETAVKDPEVNIDIANLVKEKCNLCLTK